MDPIIVYSMKSIKNKNKSIIGKERFAWNMI